MQWTLANAMGSNPRLAVSAAMAQPGPMPSACHPEVQVAAIILAAGSSTRMGRPKLLLPWGQTTIIAHLLAVWRSAGARQVVPVCAADNQDLHTELDRLGHPKTQRVFNPAPECGMFSSIQCAAVWNGWDPVVTHWAIVLGDQPHLQPATLRQLIARCALKPDRIVQPLWDGRPAHPVLLPKKVFRLLPNCSEPTLKDFLARFPQDSSTFQAQDPGLALDIDRPEDYLKALKLSPPPFDPE